GSPRRWRRSSRGAPRSRPDPQRGPGQGKLAPRVQQEQAAHGRARDRRPGARPRAEGGEDPERAEDREPVVPEIDERQHPDAPPEQQRRGGDFPPDGGARRRRGGKRHGRGAFSPIARMESANLESSRSCSFTSGMSRSKPPTSVALIAFLPSTLPFTHQP